MKRLASQLDRLLRGEVTSRQQLETGEIDFSIRTLVFGCLLLGAFYGAMMGLYGATNGGAAGLQQLVASTVKVPLLFLLTLIVTFPSLYVFSALAGSRLRFTTTLRLLLAAITVNLAVLASFGPVTAFFTLSTTSHPFMVLLNVLFFGIAGLVALGFLAKALRLAFPSEHEEPPAATAAADSEGDSGSTPPPAPVRAVRRPTAEPPDSARRVFSVWLVIYGVVGSQMGWILRPFVGNPDLPFEWFRVRESNFFAAVLAMLRRLFE